MPFGVDLGDIEDAIKEYGPNAAIGGGLGFLMGGPPGAALGVGTAIGSQMAAKEAVKALPEDSPDWLKTGVEFGVYGLGGAIGTGGLAGRGAKIGIGEALSRLRWDQVARSGIETGVGAIGGKFAADKLGIPPVIGELAGSIAGPVAVAHFAAVRNANAESLLADKVKDSNVVSRATDPGNVPLASHEEDLTRLDKSIANMQYRQQGYSTQMGDKYIQELTGGWNRADTVRLARGQMPDSVREVMTPELRNAQRNLPHLNSRYENAQQALTEAKAGLETEGGLPGPLDSGAIVPQKNFTVWRGADGTEKLLPEEALAKYQDAQKKFASVDAQMKSTLGVDQVPTDPAEQLLALRNKHVPDWQERTGGELPDAATAQQWLRDIHQGDIEQFTQNAVKKDTLQRTIDEHQALRDFLAQHPGEFGLIGKDQMAMTSRDYAAWQQQDELLQKYPGGITRALEHTEGMDNYLKYADLVSSAEGTAAQKGAKYQELLKNPQGSYVVQDPSTGAVAPKTFIGLEAPGMTQAQSLQALATGKLDGLQARVRGTNIGSPEELVPLSDLKLRYNATQLAARSAESGAAGKRIWENLPEDQKPGMAQRIKDIARPEIAADQVHYSTQAQRDAAVAAGKPDGSVITNERDDAWTRFNSNFSPVTNTLEMHNFTPEYKERMESGQKLLLNKTPRAGATNQERMDLFEARAKMTQSIQDRISENGLSVDDMDWLAEARVVRQNEVTGGAEPTDPMIPARMLAAVSHDPIYELGHATPMKGWLGQMADRVLVGQKVISSFWRGALQSHLNVAEANATFVGATYGPTIRAAQVRASELLGESEGMASVGKALGTLVRTRSLKAAFGEVHPISRQFALEGLLTKNFDPEGLPAELQSARVGLSPEQQTQVDRQFTSMWTNFVNYPKAFPGIANDEHLSTLSKWTSLLDQHVEASSQLLTSKAPSNVQKLMMMVTPEFRQYVNQDALETKGGGNVYNLAKSIFNVADEKGTMQGLRSKSFPELLTHGQEADLAGTMASYNAMSMNQLYDVIRSKAPGLSRSDLSFAGGVWQIKNLEKAPKDMWSDISGINEILSGNHRWGGLQKWSQQIAMGNLAADLSILGIQGWKVAAHSLLTGNPVAAVKTLAMGMTHIMSDAGYYSWVKQNGEELTYLASLGLTGGLKQFIAGPDIQKLPLENLPGLGHAFTGIREGTDLQFNRALYYWKVQGVRQQLDFAHTMQNIPKELAARYISSAPTAQAVADDMGGLDSYLYGDKEASVQAVVRQLNRSLGGVNMNSEGIGATRQAIEQITMVVPGFFRAQAGQWAAALTKPKTLEGQLAISMLAKEYMFAGSVATGMARLMGTEHKINWDDPSKATWLGVPMPDGSTVTLAPTMAIPRLAARVVKEAITAPQEGRVPNPLVALDQFARGRMSPLVSPILEAFEGHDFYGNTYTSNWDKWGSTLSHVTMPIIADTMINDIKEGVRQGQATGQWDVQSVASDALVQLLGKNQIPSNPGMKLNDLANQTFGTDWNLLTDDEKANMRANNPAVRGLEVQYDFVSSRSATTAESHVNAYYKQFQDDSNAVWNQPTMINGTSTTQAQDDQLLQDGQMTGDDWRSRYHTRQQSAAQWYDALKQNLSIEGYDPDKVRADHMQKLKDSRDPNDAAWLVQDARVQYLKVKPDTVPQVVTTPSGPITIQHTDWTAFRDAQQAALAPYPEAVRARATESVLADNDPTIKGYKQASEQQQAIEALPRYRGLSVDQGQTIDSVLSVMSKMADQIKGQMGLPPGTAVPGLTQAIRAKAVNSLITAGVLKTPEDMQLATVAVAMAENKKLADSMRNPTQVMAVLRSPQAVVFYPYLRYRVPKQLWGNLPAQIFQSPTAAAELQAQE